MEILDIIETEMNSITWHGHHCIENKLYQILINSLQKLFWVISFLITPEISIIFQIHLNEMYDKKQLISELLMTSKHY